MACCHTTRVISQTSNGFMKHFISIFNESVKTNWNFPAVTNFGGVTYTYAQMAECIAKYHILFKEAGIEKGEKIAIYARNSAEWVNAYFATLTYGAVTVPFLPDFIPSAVAELASFSEYSYERTCKQRKGT